MAKAKETAFFCAECGYESSKWQGKCPACGTWNSFAEAPKDIRTKSPAVKGAGAGRPVIMRDVKSETGGRILSGDREFDRVLGGGVVPGSLILVGGDPGIGKSTLLLQACGRYCSAGKKVLYISGEESAAQIKLRSDRLSQTSDELPLLCETDLGVIESVVREMKPDIVVIDSVQTMSSENVTSGPGSVTQVREAASVLMQLCKGTDTAAFLVGHVTKEGVVAGPRVLEHMVDTVLYFEGERSASYRILRAVKNRFGSTDETGVFEMRQDGLFDVEDPSSFMLSGRCKGVSGSVVTCCMEGTRPMLIEIQALITKSSYGNSRRSTNGVDYNRMNLLMAVLEKKLGLPLYECDAYLNVTGGMKAAEPAMDAGIAAAILSSYRDIVIAENMMVIGEIGLAGEIRSVSSTQQRLNEGAKLGFTRVVIPVASMKGLEIPGGVSCIPVSNVHGLLKALG